MFVPATPYDDPFPQPSVLHFLLQTLTIPSGACCAQYSTVFVPVTPYNGPFLQPSVLHFLLQMLTIPSGECCAQYSTVFVERPVLDVLSTSTCTCLIATRRETTLARVTRASSTCRQLNFNLGFALIWFYSHLVMTPCCLAFSGRIRRKFQGLPMALLLYPRVYIWSLHLARVRTNRVRLSILLVVS